MSYLKKKTFFAFICMIALGFISMGWTAVGDNDIPVRVRLYWRGLNQHGQMVIKKDAWGEVLINRQDFPISADAFVQRAVNRGFAPGQQIPPNTLHLFRQGGLLSKNQLLILGGRQLQQVTLQDAMDLGRGQHPINIEIGHINRPPNNNEPQMDLDED